MPLMTPEREYLKAGDPQTSLDELKVLVSGNSARVRRRVAENSNTPQELLEILAADEDQEVRIAVATNPLTPYWLVERLAADASIHVRFEMAEDPNLPPSVIQALAEDENPYVRDQARRTLDGLALEAALREAGFRREAGNCEKLGELLVHAGLLQLDQVDECLRMAREARLPLGRIIAQMKVLPRSTVVVALGLQSMIRREQISVEEAVCRLRPIAP